MSDGYEQRIDYGYLEQ